MEEASILEPMGASIEGIPLSDVSCTMFLMLYGRVLEGRSRNPILRDPKAEEIVGRINGSLLRSDVKLLRRLGRFKMSRSLAVYAALRARKYDAYARDFMRRNPGCSVVNLGCGMATQFWRIDDGSVRYVDVDLPEVIRLRRLLVQETDRYKMAGCSVLDFSWMDAIPDLERPVMFQAEGLLMYLPKEEVVRLVREMAKRVKAGELVAEVAHEKYTRGLSKRLLAFKLKRQLDMDPPPEYLCCIRDSAELESWSPRLRLLGEWFYMDDGDEKIGWPRILRHVEAFRKTQWTVRCRIGEKEGG